MGWFLTKKKGSKAPRSSSRAKASAASPRPWDPQRTLWGVKILFGVACAAGAVVGWYYGEEALEDYAAATMGDPVSTDDVLLADAPGWMSPEVRARVATAVAEQVSSNPLDGASLREAARALASEPWVARVERVQRLASGKVEVRADYRQPMAVVEGLDGYHLVDDQGYKLPGLYYRDQVGRLGLPLIVGVQAAPPGRPGQQWPGDDLQAGLDLVKLLAGERFFNQIESFDVGTRDNRGRLRLALRTRTGMVLWGLPVGQESAVEQSAMTKVSWLRRVNAEKGSVDAGGKVVHVYSTLQTSEPTMSEGPGGGYTFVNDGR